MSHMRRRSSHMGPSPDEPRASPLVGRTPRLGGGTTTTATGASTRVPPSPSLGFGGAGTLRSAQRDPNQAPTAREVVGRIASVILRVLRTPRALTALVWLTLMWIASSYVRENAHHLSQRPVHPRLLPLIRHSGTALEYLSPDLGGRVKSWHDDQVKNDPNRPLTPAELEAASRHTFHPNGLLLVNPKGRHPIHLLIEDAERKWKDKVARQSKTLGEAVREYKRRHRRNPPKGFDDWCVPSPSLSFLHEVPELTLDARNRWAFCEEHNIQLRDEYDQINHDLAPHWALCVPPSSHDARRPARD